MKKKGKRKSEILSWWTEGKKESIRVKWCKDTGWPVKGKSDGLDGEEEQRKKINGRNRETKAEKKGK